jgi:hypothetical protein
MLSVSTLSLPPSSDIAPNLVRLAELATGLMDRQAPIGDQIRGSGERRRFTASYLERYLTPCIRHAVVINPSEPRRRLFAEAGCSLACRQALWLHKDANTDTASTHARPDGQVT